MRKLYLGAIFAATLVLLGVPDFARGQSADPMRRLMSVAYGYRATPNITYLMADSIWFRWPSRSRRIGIIR